MGGISSYIYSYFYGNKDNNNNISTISKNNIDSSSEISPSRPKLKLKYSKFLSKEITSVNNISIFPSKKIALTVNENELYILDEKFNFLTKTKNTEKNISIKDDNLFLTYDENIISIWCINNNENNIQLKKKDIIRINDTHIIQISFNNDILGLSKNTDLYKIFKYSESEDNIHKEDASLVSRENIFCFLFLKNKNNDLIVISQKYRLKIYQINKNNFQLNTIINLNNYRHSCNMKLLNYGNDILALLIKDNTPTTYHGPLDSLIFFDKKTMKQISSKMLYWTSRTNDVDFFYKKKIFLFKGFWRISAGLIIENYKAVIDIDMNINASKFIKLNENEICTYEKNNDDRKLCIYEFE